MVYEYPQINCQEWFESQKLKSLANIIKITLLENCILCFQGISLRMSQTLLLNMT